jgi:hypothetical protein
MVHIRVKGSPRNYEDFYDPKQYVTKPLLEQEVTK